MTFEKFLQKIEETFLANQAARSNSKIKAENQWRYGQTVMNVLWEVWPQKYREIQGGSFDCFYSNQNVDLTLDKLQKEWPVFPALSEDQVRIQRLEKKIKKLQASNKRHKEDLKYYKRIVRDFPWIEPSVKTTQENIELKKTLKEKNWTIRGLQDALNTAGLISDDNLNQLKGLYEDFKVNGKIWDKYLTSGYEDNLVLLGKIISVISSMKKYTTDVEWRGHE
jgi:predicted RNase H-like nuclease (RuvC/YqgF family)